MVNFYVDGAPIGSDTVAPYEVNWNTLTTENGSRTLMVEAEGPGGTAEDQVNVTVMNLAISLQPDTAFVARGHTRQFRAIIEGVADTSVTWNISPGKNHGTISANGFYVAPEELPVQPTATIRATSGANPAKYATAPVTMIGDPSIEAENIFYPDGGTYGDLGGSIRIRKAGCSYASGGEAVDGMDVDGEWILINFELEADMCFNTRLRSTRHLMETRTYEVTFQSVASTANVWTDTLHTIPGSGCC